MNIEDTIQPKSDQANADDFVSGPRTFTISEVRRSDSAEQPVEVVLREFPQDRPWKPNKSMRRVLVYAWGVETSTYVGRQVTLYCDRSVKWAGQPVGGIRISAMSDIERPLSLSLTETRGKRAPYKVDVLKVEKPAPAKADDEMIAKLTALYEQKGVEKPDLSNVTVDEARNLWRSIQSKPDAPAGTAIPTQEPTGDWPEVAAVPR